MRSFATAHARAAAWNRMLEEYEHVQAITVSVNTVDGRRAAAGAYVVHLEYAVGVTYRRGGRTLSADLRFTANYRFADGTVRRAVASGIRDPGPDSRNGTRVGTYEQATSATP